MRNINKKSNSVPPCLSRITDDGCTGCATCANACPQNAIEIQLNNDGFYRPTLIEDKCNFCDVCIRFCPIIGREKHTKPITKFHLPEPDVYAAWSTNEDIHLKSSSGGIFSELAYHVLDNHGIVCGCAWGKNWTPHHIIIDKHEDVGQLRGSKYIPSFINEHFYQQIISLAKSGTNVLFSGTPCQVAGLSRLIQDKIRSNVILVEVVCHGVPSLTSFWSYLDWKFERKKNVKTISFRNKQITNATIRIITEKEQHLSPCGANDWYRAAMVYHFFLQKSCFACQFRNVPRYGDITLGDFWGIPDKWHDTLGDSVVLVNTTIGKNIFERILDQEQIKIKKSDFFTASRKNRQLCGVIYKEPMTRKLALYLLKNYNYKFFHQYSYRPLNLLYRIKAAAHRRLFKS